MTRKFPHKCRALLILLAFIMLMTGCTPAPGVEQPSEVTTTPVTSDTGNKGPVELDLETDVLFFGRTYLKSRVYWMNWSGSGFTFRFKGTGATAEFSSNVPDVKNLAYLKIYVDGVEMKDVVLNQGIQTVVLAEGLDPNQEHIIEVRKRTNARSSTAGLRWIDIEDGEVLPPPEPKDKVIEFLGDSLTVGYVAADGGKSATAWSTTTEDVTGTYIPQIANAFGAEYQVVAISGRGVVRNNGGDTDALFPSVYKQLDYYNNYGVEYDFANQPDVIVINLGTNDESASNTNLSESVFKNGLYQFLKEVRQYNPNAKIIYTYGLVRVTLSGAIEAVVNQLRAEGDQNIHYLQLTKCESYELNLNHTVEKAYVSRGEAIIEKIKEVTGWTTVA